jgi:hypothetical protein
MLHTAGHPLEINTDSMPGKGFVLPSPTNVSLLNFPFASPDINEPGSPLGYDLNSSILESSLENFSNSLLDINESADADGLNFSTSSDLNLSPQESPIFQLFTGPALELGLPNNSEPLPRQSPFTPEASATFQEAPLLGPILNSSLGLEEPGDLYADRSVESILQQKKDDVFWVAWFFFSHFFEPVLVTGGKDLNVSLEESLPGAGLQQIERQVFLVQNDMENMYMWYLSARPANALGKLLITLCHDF